MSHYHPGRGLPPHLLSRNYETSSTDTDGASRILHRRVVQRRQIMKLMHHLF